jgi:hypothetical protein
VPKDYAIRVCKEFGLLGESYFIIQLSGANDLFVCLSCTGSRGVSIIFSSGDAGVGDGNSDPATQQCFSNDGTNKTMFLPQFPASCPLCVMSATVFLHISSHRSCCMGSVTTVGGTQGIPEIAAPFSGGGFSNYVSLNPPSLVLCNNCIDMEKQSLLDRTGRIRLSRNTSITFPAVNTKDSSTRACPFFPLHSIPFYRLGLPHALAHHIAPAVYVHPFHYLYINHSPLLAILFLSLRHTLTSRRNREGSSFTSRVLPGSSAARLPRRQLSLALLRF